MVAQGRPKGGLHGFAIHLDTEVARRRGERDAAALELRGADRALTRTAGALLAPRLAAAARDEAAALRRARPLAVVVQLGAHGLVHEMRLQLGAEDGLLEG